ncbi:hypothetical protein PIROE2DRAFT_61043 [Piromyces sp. E2]|nr:hypothetical protein PIROE2DRAFT_61043 [Piromyces sp. E2]|eukprot:OUM63815.1 hypothetical protein PIROE2DRAFT_61043 [Piromyces sp. E2]
MVLGNKAYSNGAIAQFPIFISVFLLVTDIIIIGRHIFGETNEYGVIVDYFGKGDDSVWRLLNYDFCIICLQILKYFTVYNYSVLDIYNHKPSIVKDVIEEYAEPDYGLQYISVKSDDEDEQETGKNDNTKDAKKLPPTRDNKKRKQRKYPTKRSFFDKLFGKRKEVDEYDDENALLIVKDDEGNFDNEDDTVLIIKDNENKEEYEEEEEKEEKEKEKQIDTETNNLNKNAISSIDQTSKIQSENQSSSKTELIQPSTSCSSSIQPPKLNNNSIPPDNKIVDVIESNDKRTMEDASPSTIAKNKGKSPSQSPIITSPYMDKGKEVESSDQDDIFFDAYDQNDYVSADYSYPPSSNHSQVIPLRHVSSSTSNQLIRQESSHPESNNDSHQENDADTTQNEIPIYEIDERERVTEGNENALLYLESYYHFVPVINIKVNEAIQVMLAIRNSNRRFYKRAKREERREQREQRRREREQHRRDREQSRRSSRPPSSSSSSTRQSLEFPPFSGIDFVQEPESETPSEQESEQSQPQNSSQGPNRTNSNRSSVVSDQLRSYFNGLHSSFRRSLTGVPSV